jgi:hypothetical protein
LGDTVEWMTASSLRPNRMMSLGSAIGVIGTIIGRHIMTPTESATHLFLAILLPSGWGKDPPLLCGMSIIGLVLGAGALASGQFASAPGLEESLVLEPRMISFADELGDELAVIKNQQGNAFVAKLTGTLKKLYNAWGTIITASTINRGKSKTITWPAFTIVGAATPEMFYSSLTSSDLESGFLNRWLALPRAGYRRSPERKPTASKDRPSEELVKALKALPQQRVVSLMDQPANGPAKLPERSMVPWGEGAEEIYYAFSRKMDAMQEENKGRYELGMRATENACRLATIVAVGRGSPTVDVEDIEWGIALAELALDTLVSDIGKYMTEYVEFPRFCSMVWDEVWLKTASEPPHWMSVRGLNRRFNRSLKYGTELDRALIQLVKEERLHKVSGRQGARGPLTDGYVAIRDDENVFG